MVHGTGLLLLSAIGGYWVLERAELQKKGLKKAGRLIGWAVILVSAIGTICNVWCAASGSWCGKGGMKGVFCPFSSKMPPTSPTP